MDIFIVLNRSQNLIGTTHHYEIKAVEVNDGIFLKRVIFSQCFISQRYLYNTTNCLEDIFWDTRIMLSFLRCNIVNPDIQGHPYPVNYLIDFYLVFCKLREQFYAEESVMTIDKFSISISPCKSPENAGLYYNNNLIYFFKNGPNNYGIPIEDMYALDIDIVLRKYGLCLSTKNVYRNILNECNKINDELIWITAVDPFSNFYSGMFNYYSLISEFTFYLNKIEPFNSLGACLVYDGKEVPLNETIGSYSNSILGLRFLKPNFSHNSSDSSKISNLLVPEKTASYDCSNTVTTVRCSINNTCYYMNIMSKKPEKYFFINNSSRLDSRVSIQKMVEYFQFFLKMDIKTESCACVEPKFVFPNIPITRDDEKENFVLMKEELEKELSKGLDKSLYGTIYHELIQIFDYDYFKLLQFAKDEIFEDCKICLKHLLEKYKDCPVETIIKIAMKNCWDIELCEKSKNLFKTKQDV